MNVINRYTEKSLSRYEAISSEFPDLTKESTVVEFGCANGKTLREISDLHQLVKIIGFDLELSEDLGFESYQSDLNDFNFLKYGEIVGNSDVFLLLDVLEHLVNPWHFLDELISNAKDGAKAIVICPNYASVRSLHAYLLGELPLNEFGFFDKTHLRWLTANSLMGGLKVTGFVSSQSFITSEKPLLRFVQKLWPSRLCSQFLLTLTIKSSCAKSE